MIVCDKISEISLKFLEFLHLPKPRDWGDMYVIIILIDLISEIYLKFPHISDLGFGSICI